MHPPVNRLDGFPERFFEECQVIFPAMMMRDRPLLPLRGTGMYKVNAPLNQRQHVIGRISAEHPPVLTHCDIDRRGMGHDPALPGIMMRNRFISRTGAAGRQPGMAVNGDTGLQVHLMCSCGFFQAIDHLAIPDQFNAVEWQAASGQNFNLDCPTASWQTESGTHGLAFNLKPQERTTTDEGIACFQIPAP
ncbi:MAG: hypothetical protein UZ16_OP3001001487 [Candidatus Hinthialibacteria bacterium OLB16]|nr:MAG: hypothetical protein UZ16_OP3001001487 [Candidatus Hinthialibacteria bacterium OLB16]